MSLNHASKGHSFFFSKTGKMRNFGELFTYESYEGVFCAFSYYGVELKRDIGEYKAGTKIHRVDMCCETGELQFIDESEKTMYMTKFGEF